MADRTEYYREYYAKHKQLKNEQSRLYQRAHKAELNAKHRKRRGAREVAEIIEDRQKYAEWREKNKERIQRYTRLYYLRNRKKILARMKEYAKRKRKKSDPAKVAKRLLDRADQIVKYGYWGRINA